MLVLRDSLNRKSEDWRDIVILLYTQVSDVSVDIYKFHRLVTPPARRVAEF